MIHSELKNRLSGGRTQRGTQSESIERLLDRGLNIPAKSFLSRRGKGFRASLVNHCYRIAGGTGEAPAKAIIAIELLHAGSLIVDDIEDDSDLRRGQPTLHRQVGLSLALNTGNWMYFRALEILTELDVSESAKQTLVNGTLTTVRECHEGQAIDLVARIYELNQCEVRPTAESISRRKTATLTALAARIAAILAGAPESDQEVLAMFGGELGLCLQMRNDLDEVRCAAAEGARCDDLKNARVTWPWAWFSESCSPDQFEELQSRASDAQSETTAARHIAAILHHSIGRRAEREISRRFEQEFVRLNTVFDSQDAISDLHRTLRVMAPSS